MTENEIRNFIDGIMCRDGIYGFKKYITLENNYTRSEKMNKKHRRICENLGWVLREDQKYVDVCQ